MVARHLPRQPTPFIGREQEIASLLALLDDPTCRLLTLVGPGGIGKTRLALQLAERQMEKLPDGGWYVHLQPLHSAEDVLPTIVNALPFQAKDNLKDHLLRFLSDKCALLVLDNYEHVLESSELLADILAAAPQVKLLVTTREVLRMRAEWVRHVTGLSFPRNNTANDSPEDDAVRLFADCARRLSGDFSLEAEREHVIRICQLTEGMPLALELAAGWTTALMCAEIAAEIERGLDFLSSEVRNLPERHRSMQAVFDQSWEMLNDAEQIVFRRLSAFRGGFTYEAAEAIAGGSLSTLKHLIDKSFVKRDVSKRYDLHEMLRQFAAEQLSAAGESESIADAHSAFYVNFLDQRESAIHRPGMIAILDAIEADFDNIRVAWHRAVAARNAAALGRAIECLTWFCHRRSRFLEHEELFAQAQTQFTPFPGEKPLLIWAQLMVRRAAINIYHNDLEESFVLAEKQLQTGLDVVKLHDDPFEIAYAYYRWGNFLARTGSPDALAPLEYSLTVFRQMDRPFYISECLLWISWHYRTFYQMEQFFHYAGLCADLKRHIGDNHGASFMLRDMSIARFYQGDVAAAIDHVREAQRLMIELENHSGMIAMVLWHSYMTFRSGEFEEAHRLLDEAVEYAVFAASGTAKLEIDERLALMMCISDEDYEGAWQLWEHTYRARKPVRRLLPLVALCGLRRFEKAKKQLWLVLESYKGKLLLGPATAYVPIGAIILANQGETRQAVEIFGAVFAQPTAYVGWVHRWGLVTRLLTQLQNNLGAEAYAAAFKRGETLNVETATRQLLAYLGGEPITRQAQANQALDEPLTPRELEVLALLAQGRSNREIATDLVIAHGTVKRYVYDICQKLGADNRTRAVAHARDHNLL